MNSFFGAYDFGINQFSLSLMQLVFSYMCIYFKIEEHVLFSNKSPLRYKGVMIIVKLVCNDPSE